MTSSSSLVSPLEYSEAHLTGLRAAAGYSETLPGIPTLASARVLHRNGREVIEVLICRPLLEFLAGIQTVCLRHGKSTRKAKGRGDYHSRSMAGTAGELALHFLAKMLQLPARLMLPTLAPQPVDHRIVVDSGELAIQSKTACLTDGRTINKIYGHFRFPVDTCDDGPNYYSFALVTDENLFSESDYVRVYLFAFVPIEFLKQRANFDKAFGRHITFKDLQAADEALDYQLLHPERLPASVTIEQNIYASLISQNFEDRLLAALDVIDSSSSASRVLDMLCDQPGLFKALKALDLSHRVAERASDMVSVEQEAAPAVAEARSGALARARKELELNRQ